MVMFSSYVELPEGTVPSQMRTMVLEHLRTKLVHYWGKCWYIFQHHGAYGLSDSRYQKLWFSIVFHRYDDFTSKEWRCHPSKYANKKVQNGPKDQRTNVDFTQPTWQFHCFTCLSWLSSWRNHDEHWCFFSCDEHGTPKLQPNSAFPRCNVLDLYLVDPVRRGFHVPCTQTLGAILSHVFYIPTQGSKLTKNKLIINLKPQSSS